MAEAALKIRDHSAERERMVASQVARRGVTDKRVLDFGAGSGILFPTVALYGEPYIRIGRDVIVGPYCTLSAGVMPGHVPDQDPAVTIGDAVLIGRGSGIVGHRSVTIGDTASDSPVDDGPMIRSTLSDSIALRTSCTALLPLPSVS